MATTSARGRTASHVRAASCSSAATCRKRRSAKASRNAWSEWNLIVTDARVANPSIAERTRSIDVGGPVVAVHFFNEMAVFLLSEEACVLADANGQTRRVDLHAGAILTSTAHESRI